jgi:Ca-activated chloride channel family protein
MRLLALAFLALIPMGAQTKPAAPKPAAAVEPDDQAPIRLEVTRVSLLFTVQDKKGRFLTDLGKEEFEVIENKRPQTILEFTAESDLPLRIAILVDTSNSIRDRFKFQQEAATAFVDAVVRPHVDKAMVVSFDTSAELVSDLTDDRETLDKAIRSLRPGGGTALYDAIFFSCRDKLVQEEPREKYRRAVVILSDGEDNQSQWTRDQALEMAHKADAVVYTISTNILHVDTDGDKVLKYFAQETGGQAFFPFKATDLAQSFENIANELRHQYNVLYRPQPMKADGLYHTVDIKLKNRKDLVVRAQHGYYAPLNPALNK